MIYISIVALLSRKIIKHFYNEPVYVADGGETMAYSELIKNFNKIRDYMRDFYVYGFKSRDDYTKKSARSYDDEKRRIESWLGEYMKFHQTADGKNVFLSIDSRVTRHNPLYKAWKTKSLKMMMKMPRSTPVQDSDSRKSPAARSASPLHAR